MFTDFWVSIPSESFAVRTSSYQVVSWKLWPVVGTTNEPEPPGELSMNGWMWLRWWNTTFHDRPLFGICPSSGSVAEPEKLIVSPARKCAPSSGCAIVSCGARPTVIVSAFEAVLLLPSEVVSLTVKRPLLVYVWLGLAAVEEVPSPKSQL